MTVERDFVGEISNKCTLLLSIKTGLKVLWKRIRKMSDIKTFRKLLNDLTKIPYALRSNFR